MNPSEHPLNALTEQATEEERKKQVSPQRALHTLESDIQEAIEKKNASAASIVMAEQAQSASSTSSARPARTRPSNLNKKMLVVLASIVLALLGVGGAYYLYLQSPLAISTPAAPIRAPVIQSIVSPDRQKTLDVTGLNQAATRSKIESALLEIGDSNGSILQIIPVQKESSGTETIVGSNVFLKAVGLEAPDVLSRSLASKWMLGTYNDNGVSAPFIILTNNFFQNAYAGMIAWEATMPDDFVNVFGYADKARAQEGTSTLSSYFNIQGSFKDGILSNKDVRTFYKTDGTMLILYSFVDNDTIVITTDDKALAEIIARLEKQTYIR